MAFSFNMVKTKLNCCDRNHMTYKMQNIYHVALLTMFAFCFCCCYILFICGCIVQSLYFHHVGSRDELKQLCLVISIFTHRAIAGPTVSLQRKGLPTIVAEFFLRCAKLRCDLFPLQLMLKSGPQGKVLKDSRGPLRGEYH